MTEMNQVEQTEAIEALRRWVQRLEERLEELIKELEDPTPPKRMTGGHFDVSR